MAVLPRKLIFQVFRTLSEPGLGATGPDLAQIVQRSKSLYAVSPALFLQRDTTGPPGRCAANRGGPASVVRLAARRLGPIKSRGIGLLNGMETSPGPDSDTTHHHTRPRSVALRGAAMCAKGPEAAGARDDARSREVLLPALIGLACRVGVGRVRAGRRRHPGLCYASLAHAPFALMADPDRGTRGARKGGVLL